MCIRDRRIGNRAFSRGRDRAGAERHVGAGAAHVEGDESDRCRPASFGALVGGGLPVSYTHLTLPTRDLV